MKPLNSLFVPINGAESAQCAAEYASRIALRSRSSVTFSNAVDFVRDGMVPPRTLSGNPVVRSAEMRRVGRYLLEDLQSSAVGHSVAARMLELGSPAPSAFVNAAQRRGASAIVVGCDAEATRGSLVGRLAEDILRLSERPVFLVSRSSAQALPPSTIVAGLDGSPASKAALEFALDLAEASGARVVAVHVLSRRSSDASVRAPQLMLDEALERGAARGIAIEAALGRGLVVDELSATVKALDAELLVVGTDGPCALRGLPVGSVGTFAAKRLAVPVAVVRAHAASRNLMFPASGFGRPSSAARANLAFGDAINVAHVA